MPGPMLVELIHDNCARELMYFPAFESDLPGLTE